MLSLAMIRVEPGSTPGIGITITENTFFGLSRLLCDVVFAFCKGNWSHVILAAAVLEGFCDLPYYRYLVLGTTYYYIKSAKVDEEHGHTGGTYLIFPPSWPPLPTSYSRND